MAYNAQRLNATLTTIARRGVQFSDDILRKHNLLDRNAKQPPFKINLCTSAVRTSAEMTEADIDDLAMLLYDYATDAKMRIPAIAGVPRVGQVLATKLAAIFASHGKPLAYLTLAKDSCDDSYSLQDNGGYPRGDVWLIDDLSNRGTTKPRAAKPLLEAGYRVPSSLVVLDCGMNASAQLGAHGIELRYPATVEAVLTIGRAALSERASEFDQALAYLRAEQAKLRAQTLQPA